MTATITYLAESLNNARIDPLDRNRIDAALSHMIEIGVISGKEQLDEILTIALAAHLNNYEPEIAEYNGGDQGISLAEVWEAVNWKSWESIREISESENLLHADNARDLLRFTPEELSR